MTTSADFYQRLQPIHRLLDITEADPFSPVPADWHLVITDIRGSTRAIEQGRYKEVNLVTASTIVALLNLIPNHQMPFVFGGDGAAVLIPPHLWQAASQTLQATQQMAARAFDFELRAAIVPVGVIQEAGHALNIAKWQVSNSYQQAIFMGGGLKYVEQLIKSEAGRAYRFFADAHTPLTATADYSGLECRWQDIPAKRGEIVSLLVMATHPDSSQHPSIYREVLLTLETIYGDSDQRRPVLPSTLKLTFEDQRLQLETKVRTYGQAASQQTRYRQHLKHLNCLGNLLMNLRIKTADMDWGSHRQEISQATDYEKFDDALRMVIQGNAQQRQQLQQKLDSLHEAGSLVYGLHVTDRALMTCLVFERNGHHVHFVDGADGGYALAAKQLKSQLQALFSAAA
ncbi:MAG: DUF3095 domain-containing protein [Cyanobacteriota bacterium]|nr:DUF3095 domain-containing protein [Cyanobacteriota bacterium]